MSVPKFRAFGDEHSALFEWQLFDSRLDFLSGARGGNLALAAWPLWAGALSSTFGGLPKGGSAFEPVEPIARFALERHHGDDPNFVRAVDIENAVGKFGRKMAADGRADLAVEFRPFANLGNQALDFVVESAAQFPADGRIMLRGFGVFLIGLGMEGVGFHRPTILRIRADVT